MWSTPREAFAGVATLPDPNSPPKNRVFSTSAGAYPGASEAMPVCSQHRIGNWEQGSSDKRMGCRRVLDLCMYLKM